MSTPRTTLALAAASALLVGGATAAGADHLPEPAADRAGASSSAPARYAFSLDELNDSGVDADGRVVVRDGTVSVQLRVRGASAGLPHAMHVHVGGEGRCPTEPGDDDTPDTLLTVLDGVDEYGGIQVSLTTDGDTSADSALALDRFPVANRAGNYVYNRTLDVGEDISAELASSITDGHVVVHGLDTSGDGSYADATLPVLQGNEATLPVACGEIE